MPISLSHLGEVIVAAMADRRRVETIEALGLTALADFEHVKTVETFAHSECKLASHHGYAFDGASRVDVVLWLRKDVAVAMELKLGATRLTKSRIENEFLSPCWLSHNDRRIAGNMMAILDRRFHSLALADGLAVELSAGPVPLHQDWFVVTRADILRNWSGAARPAFSARTRCVSIGELAEAFGGKEAFNSLVEELLAIDYFDSWIC